MFEEADNVECLDDNTSPESTSQSTPSPVSTDLLFKCEWESCLAEFDVHKDFVFHVNDHIKGMPWEDK